MVAAAIFSRHGPAIRSAARRNTAARSSNGVASQAALAAMGAPRPAAAGARAGRVRLDHVDAIATAQAVDAADDVRQVDRVSGQRAERFVQPGAFTRTR